MISVAKASLSTRIAVCVSPPYPAVTAPSSMCCRARCRRLATSERNGCLLMTSPGSARKAGCRGANTIYAAGIMPTRVRPGAVRTAESIATKMPNRRVILTAKSNQAAIAATSDQRALSIDSGVDDGERGHVDDAPHGGRRCQDVDGLGDAEQDRPERQPAAGGDLQQIERNIGGIQRRHDQKIGVALEPSIGKRAAADLFRQRRITLHFAFDLEIGLLRVDKRQRQ